jgi:hypothetical protein
MTRRPHVTDEALWDLIDHGQPPAPAEPEPTPTTWLDRLFVAGVVVAALGCLAILLSTAARLIYTVVTSR